MKKSKEYEVIVQGKVSPQEKATLKIKLKPTGLTVSAWIRKMVKQFIGVK